MTTHRDLTLVCPHCGAIQDSATPAFGAPDFGDDPPGEGDLAICISCGEWVFFDPDAAGRLRKPTDDEAVDIATDRDCQDARRAWVVVDRQRKADDENQRRLRRIADWLERGGE